MLMAVVFMKPWAENPHFVTERIRLPNTFTEKQDEPTISGVVGKIGIEEKPSEGSTPVEEKPIVLKSPEPSMMISGKKVDEKVVTPDGTELPKEKKITKILVDKEKEVIHVTLIADQKIGDYNCFKLKHPPSLVIDIWNVKKEYPKNLVQVDHPLLKRVRIGVHPKKTRFIFESAQPRVPMFRVQRAEHRLVVSFGQVDSP
jgi:hypothetical protein